MAGTQARGLHVWMNGHFVGVWYRNRIGTEFFQYDDAWVHSHNARPLSLSLPLPAGNEALQGPAVANYFDNLLPDSRKIRERVQRRFRTRSTNAYDLLAAIGRDCVGAVQLLPATETPDGFDRIEGDPLSADDIEQLLRATVSETGLGRQAQSAETFRISLAGVQEKTALLRTNDHWLLPSGATPTTHILKLPLGTVPNLQFDMSDSVENEWLCLRVLASLGFATARADIGVFGNQQALVVERFDRRRFAQGPHGPWIVRLPQEDFCQATGTPGYAKYESDGGPGMAQCLSILTAAEDAPRDLLTFVTGQLAFWLLAAIDGHAKNFSIFLKPGGRFSLTPFYDVLSAWPVIGEGPGQLSLHKAKLAMAVRGKNAHYRLLEIQTRHWRELAGKSGVADAFDAMVKLVRSVDDAMHRVERELPREFPAAVWTAVRDGVLSQRDRFMGGLQTER